MAALGSTPGIIVGVGVGAAASTAIQPALEIPRQEAWKRNAHRLLPVAQLAALIAQGGVPLGDDQYDHAARDGFGSDELDGLVYLAQTVPGFGEAVRVLRRDPTFAALFAHSLAKQGIDARYHKGLTDLQYERLDPAVIALAIVRGIMADPGFLPVGPPTTEGNVKAFPQSKLPTLEEAAAAGWDYDRLFVQTAVSGRPMGPEAAAQAEFKGILLHPDFQRAVSEGDVRNEWAEAIFENTRQIPSVADYINAEIRGWITTKERNAGIARHGMKPADGDLLYLRTGRPATTHQVHIGWARGGRNPDAGTNEREVFAKAVKESDIRPEWEDILWAQRYTYPPFFALRALMQGGVLTADEGYQLLLYEGWEPTLARKVADFYTAPASSPAKENPYQVKADGQLWTALHKSYVKTGANQSDVDPLLQTLVPDDATRLSIFATWDVERDALALAPPTP